MKYFMLRMLALPPIALTALLSMQAASAQTTPTRSGGADSGSALPAVKDAAELDFRAFENGMNARPAKPMEEMTPVERAQFNEDRGMDARRRALAFLATYPNDPRRWNVVSALISYAQMPQFALSWKEPDAEGVVTPATIDEAAAAAWKARVSGLKQEMKTASDVPEEAKKVLALLAAYEEREKAFYAKWAGGQVKAPDFTTYTVDNKPVKVSDYKGKVVILDFWATWCGPCKAAMPHMQALAGKYKNQGVVVLGSGTRDKRDAFEKFVRENIGKYPNIVWSHDKDESGGAAKNLYAVLGLPTQFVIDSQGRVADVVVGHSPGEAILEGALAKAGIKVDPAILKQAEADLKRRGT